MYENAALLFQMKHNRPYLLVSNFLEPTGSLSLEATWLHNVKNEKLKKNVLFWYPLSYN